MKVIKLTQEDIKRYYTIPGAKEQILEGMTYQTFRAHCRKFGLSARNFRAPAPVKRAYGKAKPLSEQEVLDIKLLLKKVKGDAKDKLCRELSGVGYLRFKRVYKGVK